MDDDTILERGGDQDDINRYAEMNGADLTKKDIIEDTVHRAFETDLNDAQTAEDAFKILTTYYSALVELVQPEAQDKDRMKKIRLMTPNVGHAIMVYHAFVAGKVASLLEQIKKLEQRKSTFQRVKEWFRRGK
jgi:hypothetical protein